ncbi:MAG: glycoside hydrolase family 99-like domain-containing protein [Kiritimatiellae bacterium]|nr:glycoside hydrolase family 99-like domain-containing protein [Kiritimatiellia bacterium]
MKHELNRAETSKRPTVVAIYCPLWHSYPHMDAWKGEGWTEWELVKTAPPRFKGHYQPLQPAWGCFDESDPKWAAKEVGIAADHGIDVMLFDWYWYSGVRIMEEALEHGFLRAPNRNRIKFALMWANHDWGDYFPPPFKGPWNSWLSIRHSPRDFSRVMDYCIEHYFRQPNYWRLDGRLFFSLFQPEVLVDQLGGVEKTRRVLKQADRRLHARGLPSIHWNGMTSDAKRTPEFKAAGFATTTCYNVLASGKAGPGTDLIDRYEDVMEAHRKVWRTLHRAGGSYLPVVTMGWDVSPRCRHDERWPFRTAKENGAPGAFVPFESAGERKGKLRYPYIHVAVGNNPKLFGRLCRDSIRFLEQVNSKQRVVFINAWNEWTEGCYLLPEKRYGTGYLKALRSVFGLPGTKARPRRERSE